MKRSFMFLSSFVLILSLSACKTTPGTSASGSSASASAFKVRGFQSQVLPNGLTILWIEDQSLPYVSLQMMIPSGSSQDPAGKEGLAGFTGSLLEKGTSKHSAVQISENLEQIGSEFGVDVQPDYTMVSISALSFHKDTALGTFEEILETPTFPERELNRHRGIVAAGLRKLADRPGEFSDYLFARFLYGEHPYGHDAAGTLRSIRGLKRADVRNFYMRHFAPSGAIVAVVGQYDEAWKEKVVKTFSDWKQEAASGKEVPDFPRWKGTEILLVDREDLNQAQIKIGFEGVPRNVPEYMEVRAALKILGESFGSRLFDEIREKRGLTYGIYAWFDPRAKAGPMGISTFTRTDKIEETVKETLNTYRRFVKEGVTDQEVSEVKAVIRGQFPRMFETPEALARQILLLKRYDISTDYLTHYDQLVGNMTRESINAAIRKYFTPENLRILVYAPKSKAAPALRPIGKLNVKPYKEFLTY